MKPVAIVYHLYHATIWETWAQEQLLRVARAQIPAPIFISHRPSENETLNWMLQEVVPTLADGALLYFHTKGITRWSPTIQDWRELMEYFCIDRWQDAMAKLDEGYDAVGCNRNLVGPEWPDSWHFAGNFWWARVASLERVRLIAHGAHKGEAEGLVRGCGILGSLHQSRVNHYLEPYPKERYR